MDSKRLHGLSAVEAARMIRDGAISSTELVEACLARVREVDGQVQAWAFLDPEHANGRESFRASSTCGASEPAPHFWFGSVTLQHHAADGRRYRLRNTRAARQPGGSGQSSNN